MWLGIAAILVLAWIAGFVVLHVSSFLIHILLIVALIALIYHFVSGKSGSR